MGQYQFGDLILSRNDATFEDALEDAYKSKLRPECLCVSKGIPMYIGISLPHSDKELFDQISRFVTIAQNAKIGIAIPGSPSYGKCKGCAYRDRCQYVSR